MKIVQEFKEFIQRGNVMDMAVGIIVGGAFTAIVTSLTDNIIKPIIALFSGGDTNSTWCIPGTAIDIGAFVGAVINFLLIALVVFFLVKGLNTMSEAGKKLRRQEEEAAAAVEPPTCPFCLEEVKEGATRCPHCAAEFSEPAKSKTVA